MKEDYLNEERELTDEELQAVYGGLDISDLLNVGDVSAVLNRVAVGNVTTSIVISGNDLSL